MCAFEHWEMNFKVRCSTSELISLIETIYRQLNFDKSFLHKLSKCCHSLEAMTKKNKFNHTWINLLKLAHLLWQSCANIFCCTSISSIQFFSTLFLHDSEPRQLSSPFKEPTVFVSYCKISVDPRSQTVHWGRNSQTCLNWISGSNFVRLSEKFCSFIQTFSMRLEGFLVLTFQLWRRYHRNRWNYHKLLHLVKAENQLSWGNEL